MESNTAAVGNQNVNLASFSVEDRKCDPFTVVEGRYIGHDGFVVPKDFGEFYKRFPEHVRTWVGRHVNRRTPKQDVQEWTQELLLHLDCLPAISKHRASGKRDVVQTFDPRKQYGASSTRFFNYINLCLANRFKTIRSTHIKDAICRTGNFSFAESADDGDSGLADDEFCHGHSEHLRSRCQRQAKQWDARHVLAEFSEFVKREDSSLLPAMKVIAAGGTAGSLGTTEAEFCRMRSRLRQLGTCFQKCERVPKRRRPYRRCVTTRISVCVP